MEARHPIRAVARRTGLSPHLIRMWERRYGAVVPARTNSRQRLYTDDDIKRLHLLKMATDAGESIGQIASLSDEELEQLMQRVTGTTVESTSPSARADRAELIRRAVAASLDAVAALDSDRLEAILSKATVDLGQAVLLSDVLIPFMEEVGNRWQSGELKVVHEHLASAVLRTLLGEMAAAHRPTAVSPTLVTTTPVGQQHEYGALVATVVAAAQGWRTIYLGPNTPADDIAHAVKAQGARAVLLSVIYPEDDPLLARELVRLRRLVGDNVRLLVGGRGAASYQEALEQTRAVIIGDIKSLPHVLDEARAA